MIGNLRSQKNNLLQQIDFCRVFVLFKKYATK